MVIGAERDAPERIIAVAPAAVEVSGPPWWLAHESRMAIGEAPH
jgi:hypothetical protein